MHRPHVAVLAFNQISPFHLSVPCVVFGDGHPGSTGFDLEVCAAEPGALTTSAGFDIAVPLGLEALSRADIVIVPSWRNPDERPPEALLKALVQAHQRGARIVGLCLGAYVLAEAGLLDGRKATTHWEFASDFARRYPAVELNAEVLYLDDGGVLTSAGTAAGLDCCLHLVREQYGSDVANRLARRLVVAPHRQGGQAQFIDQPVPADTRNSRLTELTDWVRSHLDQPHSLDSLARRALMSRRSFTRHFRQLTGTTVGAWLLSERLALSQRLLETTDHSVVQIAALTGFGSAVSFRYQFRQAYRVSPSHWRQTFRGQ